MKELKDCINSANKDENKGKKQKGLLITKPDERKAKEYLKKAKINLGLIELYKEKGYEYKIPEEWYYTLYYCALSILSKFGVESRSQRCTAIFLRYLKDNNLVEYDEELITRITVYKDKDEESDVDIRERARYNSSIKSSDILHKYDYMMNICKKAIDQAEEIVYSNKKYSIPEEF